MFGAAVLFRSGGEQAGHQDEEGRGKPDEIVGDQGDHGLTGKSLVLCAPERRHWLQRPGARFTQTPASPPHRVKEASPASQHRRIRIACRGGFETHPYDVNNSNLSGAVRLNRSALLPD
jgi:hypothetical protein